MSRQITQLSAAGQVDRRPAPEHGRASLVSVSEKGRAELARWRAGYIEFMEKALGGWDDARVTDLTTRLAEMNADYRHALGSDAPLADTTK